MKLEIVKETNATVAAFDGELDESAAPDVRARLDRAIDECHAKNFVFDFSRLSFMDSTGIGVLLGRYKKLKSRGVSALIAKPNPHVDKILSMAGIYTIMRKLA